MMQEILDLINENKFSQVRDKLTEMNVVDIAQILEELERDKVLIVFRILPKDISADVFSYISREQQAYIIESITDKEISNIVNELFLDDTIDFIEELPASVVKKVLKNTDKDKRNFINQILKYPENSAGSIMTIEFVDLKKEMTIKEALEHVRKTGVDKETIDTCYVIDGHRKLEGVISIRKLILSDEDELVKDVMHTNLIHINTLDDQETAADTFKKYDFLTMPVVDKEKRLVGIITIDDIVDIIEQENTEDFHKMAGMEPSEEEYLKTSPFKLAKHRIVWLLVLMVSATFTGNIIRRFEDVLQSVVILTSFIPMLMDTGGNAGSQSSTLIIRSLALGEVKLNDIFKVIRKELSVSILAGSVLSIVNFLRIYYLEGIAFNVSLTVSITLLFTVILAKLVGGILPILAKKIKVDPAIMASPLITTIVDASALILYFSVASWILNI
ncbi:magnesium transporter MgtE [Gottschalkia purinilytica]|uniref:Magnesium transporter MgtE n=1 Tax=Gottschalkia purinilytica TaxID=1503 RepID=A0A0L0WAZ9_GOTPU|nr:magnesium transporter [Gottschalkia purinilytica]KNF08676.1 magnesium transporter MgtE [Gottschalkia purinilytica]